MKRVFQKTKGKEKYYPCRNLSITDNQCFIIPKKYKFSSDELTEYIVIKRQPVTLYVRINDIGRIPRKGSEKKQDFNLTKKSCNNTEIDVPKLDDDGNPTKTTVSVTWNLRPDGTAEGKGDIDPITGVSYNSDEEGLWEGTVTRDEFICENVRPTDYIQFYEDPKYTDVLKIDLKHCNPFQIGRAHV